MENKIISEGKQLTRPRFWLTWFGWNALGYFASILPTLILNLLTTQGLLKSSIWTAVQSWVYLLIILIEALMIAWVQQHVLRRVLKNHRQWFMLTFLAFTLYNLMSGGTFISMINNIQSTTGVPGFEDRQFEFTLLRYVSSFGGGLLFGLLQWLALRLEVPRARWWIVWSLGAWAVYVVLTNLAFTLLSPVIQTNPTLSALASSNAPAYQIGLQLVGYILYMAFPAISGIGLARMLVQNQAQEVRQSAKPRPAAAAATRRAEEVQTSEDSRRNFLFLRLAGAMALALMVGRLTYAMGLTDFLAGLAIPAVGNAQDNSYLSAMIYSVLAGLLLGLAQVWVLGPGYRRRWVWVVATGVGYIFQTINVGTPIQFIADWAQKGIAQNPTLFYAFGQQFGSSALFWLALGLIQAAALWQWAGKRVWAWILIVPVIQALGLLSRLLFGYPFETSVIAVAGGAALLFYLRSGWAGELYFAPRTGDTPAVEDLEEAAMILEDRLAEFPFLRGQVTVEDDMLVVSYDVLDETDFITDVALAPGKAVFFEAAQSLDKDAPLPPGVNVIATEEEIESVKVQRAGESRLPYLRVKLDESGFVKLNEYLKAHPGFTLGVALDREVLATIALTELNPEGVFVEGLSLDDAEFVAGILNNDPLPFELELVEEEGAEEKVVGVAKSTI